MNKTMLQKEINRAIARIFLFKTQRPNVWIPRNPAADVILVACKKHSARYADAESRITHRA